MQTCRHEAGHFARPVADAEELCDTNPLERGGAGLFISRTKNMQLEASMHAMPLPTHLALNCAATLFMTVNSLMAACLGLSRRISQRLLPRPSHTVTASKRKKHCI